MSRHAYFGLFLLISPGGHRAETLADCAVTAAGGSLFHLRSTYDRDRQTLSASAAERHFHTVVAAQ